MRDSLYCLIFPHPLNNHKARFLHHRIIFLVISFFIFSAFFFSSPLSPISKNVKAFADISIQELLNLTNQERKQNGLRELVDNQQLSAAASKKADDMFANNYWSHNSPNGTTPWVFIKKSGYDYVYAGENLARGFSSAQDVVNAWIASPGHKANLLSSNFNDVGFAVKSGKLEGEETFLVVQEFGSRELNPASPYSPLSPPQATNKVLGFSFAPYTVFNSHFSLSSDFAIFVILAFIIALMLDIIFLHNKKIVRFAGHSLDHILFLFAIIFVIAVFNFGAII